MDSRVSREWIVYGKSVNIFVRALNTHIKIYSYKKSHIYVERLDIMDGRDVVTLNVRVYVKWSNDRLRAVGFRRIAPIQFTQATTITTRRRLTSSSLSSSALSMRFDSPSFPPGFMPFFPALEDFDAPSRTM